ncbi:histidine phosphatase family protein [Paracoccus aurantiacus]|uniref:Histidine phosphatase family protein n=1 Tax=Paracoccus aurantiacus TaxID=2599412 RepID=A0A5C6S5V0_9RHOB|nr:histidine phosphatase family protein [Paracoccus aurantiacus]TXB69950.1 histidine phosphatase family protein [Paracoccus aurantiacus]
MRDWPDLYLMRHGQTEWNAVGRMQGHRDSPLTALGRVQAAKQADIMAPVLASAAPPALCASPLGRAVATAEIVFAGRRFATDERFREISVGEFEGRTRAELEACYPALFAESWLGWYDRAPGGERLSDLRGRVTEALSALAGPTAIVCHGITLRMIRLVVLGWPDTRLEEMEVRQGAVHLMRGGRHEMLV